MLDIKFLRDNPDVVKQNIKNKFQDYKLPLVDEVIALDAENRATMQEADTLRSNRNKLSKQIGGLMAKGEKDEAEKVKAQVNEQSARLEECEKKEAELAEKIKNIMMTIPNIIDPTVPIGKDDSENVEIERFGEPLFPILKFPTTPTSWKDSTVSTLTPRAVLQVTVFTTSWAISLVFIPRLFPMRVTS